MSEEWSTFLGSCEVDDRTYYSSNDTCPHACHEKCVIQWLVALLTRQKRDVLRRDRYNMNSAIYGSNNNHSQKNEKEVKLVKHKMLIEGAHWNKNATKKQH